jgi:hypothetical protein
MKPERVLLRHDEYASKDAYKLKPASKGKCMGWKEKLLPDEAGAFISTMTLSKTLCNKQSIIGVSSANTRMTSPG